MIKLQSYSEKMPKQLKKYIFLSLVIRNQWEAKKLIEGTLRKNLHIYLGKKQNLHRTGSKKAKNPTEKFQIRYPTRSLAALFRASKASEFSL